MHTADGTRAAASGISTPGARIDALDSLRGFALCGILVVNIYQQLVVVRGTGTMAELPDFIGLLFYERFLPIFSVLFGVGFGLFLQRAAERAERPRLVLARRLAVLLLIGAVHFVFHPGEVLTAYAVGGLIVLLPLSLLGGWAALAVAVALLLVGSQLVVGYGVIPGLLALGFALARLGVPEALARRTGRLAVAFAIAVVPAVAYLAAVLAGAGLPDLNVIGGPGGGINPVHVAGALAAATVYACGFLLLLRTRVGPGLSALLAPLGRMALTNYLTATALFLAGGVLLRIDSPDDLPQMVGMTVAILAVQVAWSRRWLATFAYGPAEWVWRCATWLRPAPLRR